MTDTPRDGSPLTPDLTTPQGSTDNPGYSTGITSTAAVPAAPTSSTDFSAGSSQSSSDSSSTADVAKDKAGEVKDSAKDAAVSVAGTAKEQAGQVAGEPKTQARDLLSQGRTELNDQARTQQKRAAGSLHALSGQLHEMSARASEPGLAQDLTDQVAGHAATLASWLEDREPGAVLDEVREYARRRPGTFLVLCAGAGVLAGRLGRGLQADASSSSEPGDSGDSRGFAEARMNTEPTETPDLSSGNGTTGGLGEDVVSAGHEYSTPSTGAADADWARTGSRP
ncbi:hypothetical protein ACPPVT_11165 [Angustibacter sp. McL0619]|uniref:hypothetical protein n=1 Tax=Angustibacter sp. McL0619 TaxID=3415676 RepID=UPI003CFA2A4E